MFPFFFWPWPITHRFGINLLLQKGKNSCFCFPKTPRVCFPPRLFLLHLRHLLPSTSHQLKKFQQQQNSVWFFSDFVINLYSVYCSLLSLFNARIIPLFKLSFTYEIAFFFWFYHFFYEEFRQTGGRHEIHLDLF